MLTDADAPATLTREVAMTAAPRSDWVVVAIVFAATACAVERTQPETGATAGTGSTTSGASATETGLDTGTSGPPTGSATAATGAQPATASTGASTGDPADQDEWCDVYDQACAEGFKCTVYGEYEQYWTHWGCLPAPGDGQLGDPCEIAEGESVFSGLDNCGPGYFCFAFDFITGKGGTCHELCDEALECPETNGGAATCIYSQGSGGLAVCLALCDPLVQDCPDMEGCYGDVSLEGFICYEPDPGQHTGERGSPCEFTNACLPGLSCQPAEAVEGCDPGWSHCCTPYCSISGGGGPCGPGEECAPFYPQFPPPGLEDVGVCTIPG